VGAQPTSSFADFVEAELPRLLGFARALTADDHDASDLVQDGLVRMARRWTSIRADGNPAGYARTVLVRLNIDRLRGLRREFPVAAVPDRPCIQAHTDAVPGWLVAAMRSLTPRQRTAIVLRYVDDLDVRSIAQAMECSVGTAKSHLSRGRDELRRRAAIAMREDQQHG
jgi:RNA polymerase sigma-70 factor (sigma-E family)